MITTFEIYQQCLTCEHSRFTGYGNILMNKNHVRCDHSEVCAIISGEEPILYSYFNEKGDFEVIRK